MNKPVLMHLRDGSRLGSPERLILGQMEELEADYRFVLVGFDTDGPTDLLSLGQRRRIPVVRLSGKGPIPLLQVTAAYRAMKRFGVGLVCTHDYKSNLVGLLAAKAAGLPCVAIFHGRTSEDWKIRRYEWLDTRLLRFFDRVVCVAATQKRRLAEAHVPEDKLTIIENGLDHAAVQARGRQGALSLRDELGIRESVRILCMVGRLSPEKGFDHGLRAAARLMRNGARDFLVVVAGEGKHRTVLERLAGELGLQRHVVFLGWRADVVSVLTESDVVVIPSLREGLPLVLLEALACANPVVASEVGGIPEVIRSHENGILVPPGDDEALARAILLVMENRGVALEMGRRGRETVERLFTARMQGEKLRTLYGSLLCGRSVGEAAPAKGG